MSRQFFFSMDVDGTQQIEANQSRTMHPQLSLIYPTLTLSDKLFCFISLILSNFIL
jgi:hypothetical protein